MVRKPFLARSDSVNSTSFDTKRKTDYWLLNECESAFPTKPQAQSIDTSFFSKAHLSTHLPSQLFYAETVYRKMSVCVLALSES
jgi:hypothetical protein